MSTHFISTYSKTALLGIQRDLHRNPMSLRVGTWEHGRLKEIRREVKRRELEEGKEVA